MEKKTVNQNTRLKEDQRAFLDDVAYRLSTDRSDVVRRILYEWQRFGSIGTAEVLRSCAKEQDGARQRPPRNLD